LKTLASFFLLSVSAFSHVTEKERAIIDGIRDASQEQVLILDGELKKASEDAKAANYAATAQISESAAKFVLADKELKTLQSAVEGIAQRAVEAEDKLSEAILSLLKWRVAAVALALAWIGFILIKLYK
jgi:hypothetical protein